MYHKFGFVYMWMCQVEIFANNMYCRLENRRPPNQFVLFKCTPRHSYCNCPAY